MLDLFGGCGGGGAAGTELGRTPSCGGEKLRGGLVFAVDGMGV